MLSTKIRLLLNVGIMALGGYWISQNPDSWTGYFALFYGATIVFYSAMKIQKLENNTESHESLD